MNIIIKNCKILVNGKEFVKQIVVNDGKISKITSMDYNIITEKETKVIDAQGMYAIPGVIDPHVHFREPGMEHKEDFFTGGKAAVKGGVTTIIDMPNTIPPTIDVEALDNKRELAKKCVANYGFHFGASVDDNVEEIKKVTNVASTKVFMNVSTGKMLVENNMLLEKIFEASKLVSVHAEGEMVAKAIGINKKVGHGLYLCHISQKSEVDEIRKAKEDKEHPVYMEVTPHHLFLTEKDTDKYVTMKPGLKSQEDQDELWKAIADGVVDTIGTDHAPHTKEEKDEKETYGVPGVETELPLLLNAVNEGRISLQKVVELCCEGPARVFGIKNKGKLLEGYDADIVLIDINKEDTVKEVCSKCKWSPFDGKKLKGWPILTIVNGNIVYDGDKVVTDNMGREVEFK